MIVLSLNDVLEADIAEKAICQECQEVYDDNDEDSKAILDGVSYFQTLVLLYQPK